jgi:hypothetical protein|tara:strand:+ start:25 stop:540 length:516 start_codon:yes stop_codon:yes gene_type:complete
MKKFLASTMFLLLLNACASTMSGNQQNVTVVANVKRANCSLSNDKGNWSVETPGSVLLTNSRLNLSARCTKKGYQDAVVSIPSVHKDSATWGNVVLGGGIGYIWDRKTGAAFIYPSTVNLNLVKNDSNTKTTDVKLTGDTTNQLKELNELYKSGVLTKDEFTLAKKKVLAQ